MPITLTGIDAGQTQYGVGSFLMFGDRTGAGSANDLDALNEFNQARYNFQTGELAGNAPGIEIPIVGNTVDEFPTQQGPLDIINGFTLPAYIQMMGPVYRKLLNDERALTLGQTTASSLTSPESGVRGNAHPAIGTGIAISTTPVTSGFSPPGGDEPIRLGITPSAAVSGNPTLTIVGTDYHDDPITDTVTLSGTDQVVTQLFFKTVTSIASSADASQTLTVAGSATATDRRYISVFRENTGSRLLYGSDIYFQKGLVPNMYREVWLDTFSMNISRDGAAALTFGCVGKRPQTNQDWAGNRSFDNTRSFTGADFVERLAFTGWQAGIFYGNPAQRLAGIDATLTIGNNIGFVPTLTGRRPPGSSFRARRNVTLEGTMEYRAEDQNLIAEVLGNDFLEDTYLELVNAASGGFPYRLRFTFGRLQFTNLPDAPVADEGFISRPMSMRALPSADGTTPAVSIRTEELDPIALSAISL